MEASLKRDIDKVTRQLRGIARDQIPFATSLALNQVAKDGQRRAQRQMRLDLDRPTPFTVRGVRHLRSNKRNLYAEVYIQPDQAEYLKYQIRGGRRTPRNKAIKVPVQIKLNKYGNIPRTKINTLLKSGKVFIASKYDNNPRTKHLQPGIYRRVAKGEQVQLLVAFENEAQYTKRYDFELTVIREVKARITPAMRQAINRALATAK
jgi:hypothetical protein